jgi:hypothetical protein
VVEFETAYFHSADIHSWIHTLHTLSAYGGKKVLAGHGPSLFPYSYIEEFAGYLEAVERCARLCFARYHAEEPVEKDEDRFADANAAEAKELVERIFSEGGSEIDFLEEKAGKPDARRAVRMTLWEFIRGQIR